MKGLARLVSDEVGQLEALEISPKLDVKKDAPAVVKLDHFLPFLPGFFWGKDQEKSFKNPPLRIVLHLPPCVRILQNFARKDFEDVVTAYQRSSHRLLVARFYLGISKNRGIPKWMVYNGKSH